MNLEVVPKSFWHSLSIALLAFTLGFLFISYKYGDLTVKFNQLELRTTNTESLESSLAMQEKSLSERDALIKQREAEIEELVALLDKKAMELEGVKKELSDLQASNNSEKTKTVLSRIEKITEDGAFQQNYQIKRDSLLSLEKQQQEHVNIYDQQRSIYTMQQKQQQLLAQ